tara:strand:+ start:1195 stop:1503 length:309 start_codon:yes stop_codon:yes gene_type:complete
VKRIDVNRTGDMSEHYAITWLWDNGYEVFRNCGSTGLIDLIAVSKKGRVRLIDVKSYTVPNGAKEKDRKPSGVRTEAQKKLGVELLYYNVDTRKLKFVEHKK